MRKDFSIMTQNSNAIGEKINKTNYIFVLYCQITIKFQNTADTLGEDI